MPRKQKQKVYIVFKAYYRDVESEVVAVYASKNKAEQAARRIMDRNGLYNAFVMGFTVRGATYNDGEPDVPYVSVRRTLL